MNYSLSTAGISTNNDSHLQFGLVPWFACRRSCCDMVLILKRSGKLILDTAAGHPSSLRSYL